MRLWLPTAPTDTVTTPQWLILPHAYANGPLGSLRYRADTTRESRMC